jgi:hypothetical protein
VSLHTLKIIAVYEMKTLLRSWFFRIFSALAIFGLGIFNIVAMIEAGNAPWILRALPAAIPYANLIILNLGQAIVAVFLSTEFLKQDQKNDTVEVIYARSMTNSLYIWGKTLGILLVFFILNLIVLGLGIGFSFLSNDSAFNLLSYLSYPLFISIPTLVFILGLAFFMMIWIKNQAITFIILLGYIALTIFYLNQKWFHIFDYIAYQVPMMHSTIGGFGNLQEILLHRGIYFLLGIACIFFTITRLHRLPQGRHRIKLPLVLGFVFLLLGVALGYRYISQKTASLRLKSKMVELNNLYINRPRATITDYHMLVEHQEDKLDVKCSMNAFNNNQDPIDTLLLRLNPDLHIDSLTVNRQVHDFRRNLHLIHILLDHSLMPADSLQIDIRYSGTINEDVAFLDQSDDDYVDNVSVVMYRIRKRYAYLTPDFVCLTSDVNWYPEPGAGYNTKKAGWYQPDFSVFSTTVVTSPGLTAVSQGQVSKTDTSTTNFVTDGAVPKISLLIGKYEHKSILVDSVEYNLFYWQKNDFFKSYLDSISDTIPSVIRELSNGFEADKGLEYGFNRFNLVEVPVHFCLDKHIYALTSNAVQPEAILYPEKGALLKNTDFRHNKKQAEKDMKRNNQEVTAKELQIRMLKEVLRDNFMARPGDGFPYNHVVNPQILNIFPNYYSFVTQLCSDDYWLLNQALEVFLKNRNTATGYTAPWSRDGLSSSEKINLELKQKSLQQLLATGVRKEKEKQGQINLNDVIQSKGMQLFGMLRVRYGKENFDRFILDFVKAYPHQTFSLDEFVQAVQEAFDGNIKKDIDKWYNINELPGYLIQDVKNYKIVEDEYTRYQVRFNISNPTRVDGQVTVSMEFKDENNNRHSGWWNSSIQVDYSKDVFVPAQSSRSVGMVFSTEPLNMAVFTNISENLPNYLQYSFNGFNETSAARPFDSVTIIPFFDSYKEKDGFIVDNEDDGFSTIQKSQKGVLKEWADQRRETKYPYSRIKFWDPPGNWQKVLRSGFYGKFVRSAMYTQGGKGELRVTWKCPVQEPAAYDIYFYLDKFEMGWRGNRKNADYNFTVIHSEGEEDVHLSWEELESGWNYLGSWYIDSDTASVSLSNKSQGSIIFADAVKWVKE